ncbi:MAG TPA: thiamine pyrophosphate-dependent enzyme [Armatimonadaceae bacterium]|jgi:pyruvate dehydrogenase E1 component alpha subunit|nr:thiamine pyrophosphate-dependent enzyme [Armatimonadaceae bacterium]
MAKGSPTATPSKKVKFDSEKYLHFYEQMVHIREFEEICEPAFRAGSHGIGGYLHLYSGEEAIAVGIIGAMDLKDGDCFIGHYRDHAYALAAGSDPGQVMAEICGKATGCSKGKGGSMHICDAERGFYGGYGIVGGNVPISVGLGWSIKYRGGDQVCACFFGDGSMNQGGFHESLNMAQLYKLPVLFVLENNGYAMGTSIERSHANPDLASRVESYAMKHDTIDGQNIFTVHERVSEIIAEMRKDPQPFFLECKTYRYHGHGAADGAVTQSTYRTKDEVEFWRTERDPIVVAERILLEAGALSEADRDRIHAEAKEAAKAALQFADDSPNPAPEDLLKDVYA